MTDYVLGTTIILQIAYYDQSNLPLDADAGIAVSVEIRDAHKRIVQTNLIATKISTGTYQYKYRTTTLEEGTYYFTFTGYFDGDPDKKSGTFTLKTVL